MPRSLQGRMLLLSVVATLVALLIAGWTIGGVLGRFVTAGLDRRLDSEIALMASTVDANGRIDRDRLQRRLAAFEEGPGWRWRIGGPDGVVGSADFPRLDEGPPGPPGFEHDRPDHRAGLRPRDGDEAGIPVHARELVLRSSRGDVTLLAAAPRSIVRRPITDAMIPLLGALASLAVILTIATVLQLRLGLRPLRKLRDDIAGIRRGTSAAIDEDQPAELRPLAVELNALTRDNQSALATARLSAANLAHALKTPVATLALEVRDEPARAAQVARIDATIRHHLARARVDTVDRRAATRLAPAVADLIATVRRLHAERALSIDAAISDHIRVAVDAHDLDEILGNLLDNAARHARHRITVTANASAADARSIEVRIADDGPGIPPADRKRVTTPGTRLDERGDGHGFGLGIVTDMLALYGGLMLLDNADDGGLVVSIDLPSA